MSKYIRNHIEYVETKGLKYYYIIVPKIYWNCLQSVHKIIPEIIHETVTETVQEIIPNILYTLV